MSVTISREQAGADFTKRNWPGDGAMIYPQHGVVIEFTRPVGRGETTFFVEVGRSSFEALAKAMMRAAPQQAAKAFGKALAVARFDE